MLWRHTQLLGIGLFAERAPGTARVVPELALRAPQLIALVLEGCEVLEGDLLVRCPGDEVDAPSQQGKLVCTRWPERSVGNVAGVRLLAADCLRQIACVIKLYI
jgi:hypothetical protein